MSILRSLLVTLILLGTPVVLAFGDWGQRCSASVEAAEKTVPAFQAGLDGWYTYDFSPNWAYQYEKGYLQKTTSTKNGTSFLWDREKQAWILETVTQDPLKKPIFENFGLDLQQLAKVRPAYIIGGQEVSQEDAQALVEAPEIPDDKNKPWLIAIGADEYLKSVEKDLATSILKQMVRFQALKLDTWQAKRFGLSDFEPFKASQKALLLVAPDEKVVHLQTDYQAKDLALLAQTFDPHKVPDLRKMPDSGTALNLLLDKILNKIKEEPVVWLAGAIVIVLLLRKPQK